jgi:hypothetical protein
MSQLSLRAVIDGPFAEWLGPDDWSAWRAFLLALRGEPMSAAEGTVYTQCTGRQQPPSAPFNEAWIVAGRRARKSAIAAVLGCHLAVYHKWPRAPGESVRVLIIAVNKDQAKLVRNYCEAILLSRPGLKRLIKASDTESITLSSGVQIVCVANSFRSIRGPTVVCAIFDEVAYWRDENSANPDKEILRAVRPAMLTVPGALLIGLSSPYAKRGLLFEKFKEHFGRDDARVLVWQASTEKMNPQVDKDIIAAAYVDDPVAASAEYGALFRTDIESFVAREAVEGCVVPNRHELSPVSGVNYTAFVDPSGGSSDSMTVAIAHRDRDGRGILDAVREVWPPFSPEAVVTDFAALLKSYRVFKLTGDRWGGEFVREPFRSHGVQYELSDKPKSDLYRDLLPLVNSGKVELLDHSRLVTQLCGLERRTARSGKDSIDHAPGAHDDLVNAAAGALVRCAGQLSKAEQWARFGKIPMPRLAPPGLPQSAIVYAQMRARGW